MSRATRIDRNRVLEGLFTEFCYHRTEAKRQKFLTALKEAIAAKDVVSSSRWLTIYELEGIRSDGKN